MSLFKRENRDAALGNLVDLLALREGGLYNYTGEKVNEMSALGISTVYSAISLIADSIALLPVKTLRYDGQKTIFTEKPKLGIAAFGTGVRGKSDNVRFKGKGIGGFSDPSSVFVDYENL